LNSKNQVSRSFLFSRLAPCLMLLACFGSAPSMSQVTEWNINGDVCGPERISVNSARNYRRQFGAVLNISADDVMPVSCNVMTSYNYSRHHVAFHVFNDGTQAGDIICQMNEYTPDGHKQNVTTGSVVDLPAGSSSTISFEDLLRDSRDNRFHARCVLCPQCSIGGGWNDFSTEYIN
jgi:hypothetical protein